MLDAETVISSYATLYYLTDLFVTGKGRGYKLSEDFNEVEHFYKLSKLLTSEYLKKYEKTLNAGIEIRKRLFEFYIKNETDEHKIEEIRRVFEDYHGKL